MAPETPRGVSSRLLTMKFMQRAAAASPSGSPESDQNSAKKRKLGHSPSTGRIDLNINQAAIQAALDDQEAKRQAALDKHVGADTRWVLNTKFSNAQAKSAKPGLNVVYVGYGDIDASSDSDEHEDDAAQGRTSTKNYKKSNIQKPKQKDESDSSNNSSDEDSENPSSGRKRKASSSDDPNAESDRSRSQSRSRTRQSQESAKAKEFRDKRKKKEVRLNKLTSISSAGDSQFGARSSPSGKSFTCYKCQQPGHKAVDCPKSGGSRGRS